MKKTQVADKARGYAEQFKNERGHRKFWSAAEDALLASLLAEGVNSGRWVSKNVPEFSARSAGSISIRMSVLKSRGLVKAHE